MWTGSCILQARVSCWCIWCTYVVLQMLPPFAADSVECILCTDILCLLPLDTNGKLIDCSPAIFLGYYYYSVVWWLKSAVYYFRPWLRHVVAQHSYSSCYDFPWFPTPAQHLTRLPGPPPWPLQHVVWMSGVPEMSVFLWMRGTYFGVLSWIVMVGMWWSYSEKMDCQGGLRVLYWLGPSNSTGRSGGYWIPQSCCWLEVGLFPSMSTRGLWSLKPKLSSKHSHTFFSVSD